MTRLPSPRGAISELVLEVLGSDPAPIPAVRLSVAGDPLPHEDLHLSLYLCYELHYRGLEGVDERWEWEPSLLRVRAELERLFEEALLDAVPLRDEPVPADEIDLALRAIAEDEDGPSLSSYVRLKA